MGRLGLYRVTDPAFPQWEGCQSDYDTSYGDDVVVALGSAWVWGRDDALDYARDCAEACAEAQDYDDEDENARVRPYRVERVLLDRAREILAYFPEELRALGLVDDDDEDEEEEESWTV